MDSRTTDLAGLMRTSSKTSLRAYAQRLAADKRGGAALEFALIAGPLLFLIMSCFEIAFVILIGFSLDNATAVVARQIRMGIKTSGNSTASDFKTDICNTLGWMQSDCMANLLIDVHTYPNFGAVPLTPPVTNGNLDTSNFAYAIGGTGAIQVVNIYYPWRTYTTYLNFGTRNLNSGKVLVTSRFIFKNEPF